MKLFIKITPFLLVFALSTTLAAPTFAKTPKPTLAQIETAKNLEIQKKAAARSAASMLELANRSLKSLTIHASETRGSYQRAQRALGVAAENSRLATNYLKVTQSALSDARDTIGKLAINAYKMGGGFSDVEPLMSSNGPQELIDRLLTLNNLGKSNKISLHRYQAAEKVDKQAKIKADNTQIIQQRATAVVAVAKKDAEVAQAAQQAEVDKLQRVQDQLLQELASAKKFRITLEQQRQLALLEEAKANRATKVFNQAKIWSNEGSRGRTTIRSTEAQRAIAVAFAKQQVLAGKPYVWGAQGPNSFDCSGLVYAAFKAAGLGWPIWGRLNASLYYQTTKHIPLAQMQPGDLIFYSFDGSAQNIHHMSIYEGNGMDWEARSTRTGLRHSNIYSVDGLMPFAGRV